MRPIIKLALRKLRIQERLAGNKENANAITKALWDDDVIDAVADYCLPKYAAKRGYTTQELGDGKLLEVIQNFMEWVLANGPAIIEFIMTLIAIFSEETVAGIRSPIVGLIAILLLLFAGAWSQASAAYVVQGNCANGQCVTCDCVNCDCVDCQCGGPAQIIRYAPATTGVVIEAPTERPIARVVTAPVVVSAVVTRNTAQAVRNTIQYRQPVRTCLRRSCGMMRNILRRVQLRQ